MAKPKTLEEAIEQIAALQTQVKELTEAAKEAKKEASEAKKALKAAEALNEDLQNSLETAETSKAAGKPVVKIGSKQYVVTAKRFILGGKEYSAKDVAEDTDGIQEKLLEKRKDGTPKSMILVPVESKK